MDSIKILHTGDLHLGSTFKNLDTRQCLLRKNELEYTVMSVLDSGSRFDVVLMSGDVFDSPDTPTPVADMFLNKIKSIHDTVYIMACGNHDPYFSPVIEYCRKNAPDNLRIFGCDEVECVYLEKFNTKIYGVSFPEATPGVSLVDSLPECDSDSINILCVHGDLGSGQYNPVSLDFVSRRGINYLAMGHIHKFSGVQTYRTMKYAYCGIPEGRGFDECGDKGVVCGTLSKEHINLIFEPMCRRKYIDGSVDISDCRDYESVSDKVCRQITSYDNLYRFTLVGENRINTFLRTELVESRIDAFYLKCSDCTHAACDIDADAKLSDLKGLCAAETLKLIGQSAPEERERYMKAYNVLRNIFDGREGV